MERFEILHGGGEPYVPIRERGFAVRENSVLNKGSAFPQREREALDLLGLLPPATTTIEQQMARVRENFDRGDKDPLEKYIFLVALQGRNETLFYRFLLENLEELAPIVYTPTVGEACRKFSHIYRKSRGLTIVPGDAAAIERTLRNAQYGDVDIIVVTDNERILGLGDLGAGGIGIPIGKLSLYVAGAGIHPASTLPISLDVGTSNEELLKDPMYLGVRRKRLAGTEYTEYIDHFVNAVRKVFPSALIQWEDFKKENAITIMNAYRDRVCSFNDDIQGTAAIAHAGVSGAMKILGRRMRDQRIVIMGAGASASGISRQLRTGMMADELGAREAAGRIFLLDSEGLLTDRRTYREEYKKALAVPDDVTTGWSVADRGRISLKEVVACARPTVLIGVSGQPGIFTEEIVRTMAAGVDRPIVMPMSNPTSKCEATPADLYRWTEGRALVATGSPFKPVDVGGKTREAAQANNVLIFPGVGLGTIAARSTRVTDGMFIAASEAAGSLLTAEEIRRERVLPSIARLREISKTVALAVARRAVKEGVAPAASDDEVARRIDDKMWYPAYIPYRAV